MCATRGRAVWLCAIRIPFLQDARIFAHNGVVAGLDVLDARLALLRAADLVLGQTDSERVVALITASIRAASGDEEAGLLDAMSWLGLAGFRLLAKRLVHQVVVVDVGSPDLRLGMGADGVGGYTAPQGAELTATDWNPSWAWGAGNMISTLEDVRIWAHALATGPLLTPETQRQRLDSTVPMNPEKSAFYGLGIFNAGGWIGHSGSIFGYQTVALYLPPTQSTLVFFINTDTPHQASTTLASAITSVISPDHVYR